jgi:cyclopropane fatty-acyl-phospholipid synthase-like methyltransferase
MNENDFARIIVESKAFPTQKRLLFEMNSLFGQIDFKGKKVLDIGGGEGILSFYAEIKGAVEVVCLEPEGEGGEMGILQKFIALQQVLQCRKVQLVKDTFQNYITENKFDIVVMHDSVNHLNEPACINLKNIPEFRNEYVSYFKKLHDLMKPGGNLIITDCSNINFWPLVGLANPFSNTMEWEKHQTPEIWKQIVEESGFMFKKLSWSSINRFGAFGKIIFGNRLAAFFLVSHFKLYFTNL